MLFMYSLTEYSLILAPPFQHHFVSNFTLCCTHVLSLKVCTDGRTFVFCVPGCCGEMRVLNSLPGVLGMFAIPFVVPVFPNLHSAGSLFSLLFLFNVLSKVQGVEKVPIFVLRHFS